MRDVNDSSFMLLADPGDWTIAQGVAWNGEAHDLAGKQNWRLPPALTPANARAVLAATSPVVLDGFGAVARLTDDRGGVESLDGATWVRITDIDNTALAPKVGRFATGRTAFSNCLICADAGGWTRRKTRPWR